MDHPKHSLGSPRRNRDSLHSQQRTMLTSSSKQLPQTQKKMGTEASYPTISSSLVDLSLKQATLSSRKQ